MHAGFNRWEDCLRNHRQLADNHPSLAPDEARRNPLRNGGALLQSRAVCGLSGRRMTIKSLPASD